MFRLKLMTWRTAHQRDGDGTRYFSKCVTEGLSLWLKENNELRKRMGKAGLVAPTALSASSPLLMAALDTLSDAILCPVDEQHSAEEWLQHLGQKVKSRYDSEYVGPVRATLQPVHDALRSLGLLT